MYKTRAILVLRILGHINNVDLNDHVEFCKDSLPLAVLLNFVWTRERKPTTRLEIQSQGCC